MRYPEDELYDLVQAVNPRAVINRKTVRAIRRSQKRLPPTSQYRYSIVLESMPGGPYVGPETVRYDKYNMTLYSQAHPLRLPKGKYTYTWDLIREIYDRYGFLLRTEDIINDFISPDRGLRLAQLCILYEGTIRIVFDDVIYLDEVLTNTELDGFIQEIL